MSKYEEIRSKIVELEKQAQELLTSEKKTAIQDIKEKIRRYGITAVELGLAEKSKSAGSAAKTAKGETAVKKGSRKSANKAAKSKTPVAPKYRGPNGETWAGRGKRPLWVNEIIAAGGDMQDYLVSK